MKRLPLAKQSFRKIIESNNLYVDKTDLIYNLVTDYEAVFLSRPRRFGKTLILNTIKELFSGDKELFKGLKIYSSDFKFEEHPVIYLNMAVRSNSSEILEKDLINKLNLIAKDYNLTLEVEGENLALAELIEKINIKYGKKVVLLVDEYDDPVSAHADDEALARSNSGVLRTFYTSLKDCHESLHFVFVTGVTRYAMMGLSSGLNHLTDITFNRRFSSICGFTHDELDQYFRDFYPSVLNNIIKNGYLPDNSNEFDLFQKLIDWYDGYSWDGEIKVLNPISILNFFDTSIFSDYWANTAPSAILLNNIISKSPFEFTYDKLIEIPERKFYTTTIDNFDKLAFLFQTGYLTINKITLDADDKRLFTLLPPNKEVKYDYFNILSNSLSHLLIKNAKLEAKNFFDAIITKDGDKLTNIIGAVFSLLPAEHHESNPAKESFYHCVFSAYCLGLAGEVRLEEAGAVGDSDLVLILKDDWRAIIEFKFEGASPNPDSALARLAQNALDAIEAKRYDRHHRHRGKKVVTIGVGILGRGLAKAVFKRDA